MVKESEVVHIRSDEVGSRTLKIFRSRQETHVIEHLAHLLSSGCLPGSWRTFEDEIERNVRLWVYTSSSYISCNPLISLKLANQRFAAHHICKELAEIESCIVGPVKILIEILRREENFRFLALRALHGSSFLFLSFSIRDQILNIASIAKIGSIASPREESDSHVLGFLCCFESLLFELEFENLSQLLIIKVFEVECVAELKSPCETRVRIFQHFLHLFLVAQ